MTSIQQPKLYLQDDIEITTETANFGASVVTINSLSLNNNPINNVADGTSLQSAATVNQLTSAIDAVNGDLSTTNSSINAVQSQVDTLQGIADYYSGLNINFADDSISLTSDKDISISATNEIKLANGNGVRSIGGKFIGNLSGNADTASFAYSAASSSTAVTASNSLACSGNSATATTATTSINIDSTKSSGVNQQSLCLFYTTPPNSYNKVQGAFNQNGVNFLTANPQGTGNFSINGGSYIHDYPYIVFTGAEQTNWTSGTQYSKFTGSALYFFSGSNISTLTANSLTVATVNAVLNGNASTSTLSSNSLITTASANANYNLLVATASSGNLPISGSGSDLTYNPVSQTLSVKNMNVSGNENQTGTISTNILKTDIMLQQVSYFSTQTLTILTVTDLKAYGTFLMSQYDSGSTLVNSVITVNLPQLPTDGSMDGYTFQLRKVRGGVNQTSPNWIINSLGGAYLLPNGNTLNIGSGGTNSTSNLNSFTQRYTIITVANVGYYIGCQT